MIWLVCKSQTDTSVVIFKITRLANKYKSLQDSFLSLVVTHVCVCVCVCVPFIIGCYLNIPSCRAETYSRLTMIRACVRAAHFHHNVHFLWTCTLEI